MNSKDPAVLFFINDWLTSTLEMDADCRGWYLSLLLHNYDKTDLPNDLEKLASLAGVKFSEFNRFKHVFEQTLKQKFIQKENGRLTNPKTFEILQKRQDFKQKRSDAGKTSYLLKFFKENFAKEAQNKGLSVFVKENLDLNIDLKNEQVIKHMFEHLFELYRNENENENKDKNEIEIENTKKTNPKKNNPKKSKTTLPFENNEFVSAWNRWLDYKKNEHQFLYKSPQSSQQALNLLQKLAQNNPQTAIQIIEQSIANGWKGFFELKTPQNEYANYPNNNYRANFQPNQNKVSGVQLLQSGKLRIPDLS